MKNYEIDVKKKILSWRNSLNYTNNIHQYEYDNQKTYRVRELTAFNDEVFIVNAFKAIFKRPPDESGLEHYLTKLMDGQSKISILKELLASPEASQAKIRLKKLKFHEALGHISQWLFFPQIKQVLKAFNFIGNYKRLIKHQKRLANLENKLRENEVAISNLRSKNNFQAKEIESLILELNLSSNINLPEWDDFYLNLELYFRGSQELIKKRLEIYLPYLQAIETGDKNSMLLDIGCGRGEWLELLTENKFNAFGIDVNSSMIAECKSRNLHAMLTDALSFLNTQPANSFKAITGFQIIEHLSFTTMINLIKEAYRTLMPGGVLIFETPNANNAKVSGCSFYLDPTHKKPLPPQLLHFIFSYFGFAEVKQIFLHPEDSVTQDGQPFDHSQLESLAQDFAIIGYK